VSYEFPDERHHQDFTAEQEDDAMMPEVNEAIKQNFSRIEFPVVLTCGDDRIVASASMKELSGQGLPVDRPFLRLFGGKYGAANILAVAVTAQYGPEYTQDKLGRDFHGLADEVAGRAADLNVFMISHSSEDAERGQGALGCARISALGKLNQISAKDQLSIRVAEADSESLFGISGRKSGFHEIPGAFAMASRIYFGSRPQDYAITRKDTAREPVMILAGGHADPEKDGVIHVVNLQKDRVSDVNEAVARGHYFYDSDVTIVAETLMRSFPELHLDPRFLLNSMLLDQSATRAALAAAGGGAADPQRIPSHRYGGGREALDYLSSL
jgi:hypothetical protein